MNAVSNGQFEDHTPATDTWYRRPIFTWLTVAAVFGFAFLLHFSTYQTMAATWLRSDTFLHCSIIFPISAFLIWRRKAVLWAIPVHSCLPGVLLLLLLSAIWWVSHRLGVQVVEELASVATIPAIVFTLLGPAFTRAIAFPLAYLVFAVPFGEAVIPYLIEFTATFTVKALQITGFSVYRDGVFFSLPTGNFEVAKACSGIRYLLASLALGTLFGYLAYDSPKKRIAFFLFALILPIVANGLRAYGIVLVAHFSDMRLAVGVDHLIFGWVFFGIVMFLMFWVGDRFRDHPLTDTAQFKKLSIPDVSASPPSRVLATAFLAAAAIAAGPLAANQSVKATAATTPPQLPAVQGSTAMTFGPAPDWRPAYSGADFERHGRYEWQGRIIDVAVLRYDSNRQGAELANAANRPFEEENWTLLSSDRRPLPGPADEARVITEYRLQGPGTVRIVWTWHEVNGYPVDGSLATKWREALTLLKREPTISVAYSVSLLVGIAGEQADVKTLDSFLAAAWTNLHGCVLPQNPEANCLAKRGGQATGMETE